MSYRVKLAAFEGPFDLLVYLIENAQMSIYDIQVSEITSQYLEYLAQMQRQNILLSTEFMVLAAELIQIKSRMMLPKAETDIENGLVEDPRSELAQRLAEYKKCKQSAEMLAGQQELMSGVFEKPQEDISEYLDHPDEYLALDMEQFVKAFHLFLHKKKKIEETRKHYTLLRRERETMENRMKHICRIIKATGERAREGIDFREFVPDEQDRYDVVVSFVSLLQLMREKFLDARQGGLFGRILVTPGLRDISDARMETENRESS